MWPTYSNRSPNEDSDRRLNAFTACKMIISNCNKMPWNVRTDYVWRLLQRDPPGSMAHSKMKLSELRYQARLIEEAEDIVANNWLKSYQILTQQDSRPNKYAVMIWLSTLACSKIDKGVLTVFALAFTRPELQGARSDR
jgi:hypothetical protein